MVRLFHKSSSNISVWRIWRLKMTHSSGGFTLGSLFSRAVYVYLLLDWYVHSQLGRYCFYQPVQFPVRWDMKLWVLLQKSKTCFLHQYDHGSSTEYCESNFHIIDVTAAITFTHKVLCSSGYNEPAAIAHSVCVKDRLPINWHWLIKIKL